VLEIEASEAGGESGDAVGGRFGGVDEEDEHATQTAEPTAAGQVLKERPVERLVAYDDPGSCGHAKEGGLELRETHLGILVDASACEKGHSRVWVGRVRKEPYLWHG
jgi:hypothetical protein